MSMGYGNDCVKYGQNVDYVIKFKLTNSKEDYHEQK